MTEKCKTITAEASYNIYTWLLEMTVGVLTTCHTQYTWDSSICIFYLIEQHSKLVTYLTGALYVHPLWFYKHQHDNPIRSKLFVARQRWWLLLHTHPLSWNCAYHIRMEMSDGGSLPNLARNCRWTIVTDRHSWNVSTQNAFSLPFAAILVNCAPSGEMHNYRTPHIIKGNFENFLTIGATTYCYLKCTVYDKLLKPQTII